MAQGNRIYPGCDPNVRKYEDDAAEANRQANYARATIGADGEHYLPNATTSLESGDRWFDEALAAQKRNHRQIHKGGFRDLLRMAWATIWHMGMYSEDPYLSRIAMVHTAQEQIGVQRQIATQHRVEDKMGEEERMRMMARIMLEEADRYRREHA